jgi:hypothetical protein
MKDKANIVLLRKEREKDNEFLNPYIDWALKRLMGE